MKNFFIFLFIFLSITSAIWFFDNSKINKNPGDIQQIINIKKDPTDEELKSMIGQMVMVGFNGSIVSEESAIIKTLKDINLGGVIFFNRNGTSNIVNYNQTKTLIDNLQKYAQTPLFIAVDAEGGKVNRIDNLIEIKSAYEMGANKTNQITNEESAKLAEELKALGFNMNLAPVLDIDVSNNPAIGGLERAFSNKPSQVTYQANNFILNHLKQNIITVVKHFPGHGSAFQDTHEELADITSTYSKSELLPYQELNKKGLLKVVMVGHLINKNIDPVYPASLSAKFIQDILRQDIGFNGVVMSDDLHMLAIKNNYTFEESIVLAINAGVDIVVATKNMSKEYNQNTAYQMVEIIFNNVKKGNIPPERITESYDKVINLKKQFDIID